MLLASLADPDAIRYRQQILADCIAEPEIIRQMYRSPSARCEDKRHAWGILALPAAHIHPVRRRSASSKS